jgi:hypothetical protein
MGNALATAAAVLVVLLFGVALFSLANNEFAVAGFCFLSASLTIYIRATRLVDG